MNSNYRFDQRSEEEFLKDIKNRTLEERKLFFLWLDLVQKETGTRPIFKDTGCGKDGDYLEDDQVSTDPDFEVEGYGKLEVKFSKPICETFFHLKEGQVKSYYKSGAIILMINGARSEIPTFTMLKSETLKDIIDTCKLVPFAGFGYKMSYKIPISKFVWRPLK